MRIDPPPGYDDMLGDADTDELAKVLPMYRPIEVKDVGTVKARKPLPNSVPALAMAANAQIGTKGQADYLMLFVKNHVPDYELERLLVGMMVGELPQNTMSLVAEAVSTWGTARPTRPSSTCR